MDYKNLQKTNLSSWTKKNPESVQRIKDLTSFLPPTAPIRQRLWHLAEQMLSPKHCANSTCTNVVDWCSSRNVYKTYCSTECQHIHQHKNPDCIEKRQKTSIARHGVDNVFRDKERIRKARINKLGVEHAMQSQSIKDKARDTNITKYGDTTILKTENHKNARRVAIAEQGGQIVINEKISQTKKQQSTMSYWASHYASVSSHQVEHVFRSLNDPQWLQTENKSKSLTQIASELGVTQPTVTRAFKKFELPVKMGNSHPQNDIKQWIHSVCPSLDVVENSRAIIAPLELDLYIPSLQLAIEHNGLYWHSECAGKKDRQYHITKTRLCAQRNIRLVHIFEDEWLQKSDIVKSRLANALQIITTKIYARECTVEFIDSRTGKDFFDEHHIQGGIKTPSVSIGLFNNSKLVAAMCIGKNRFENSDSYEIYRFANAKYTSVIGSANKLFSAFVRNYTPERVISYADLRWAIAANGGVYGKMGFEFSGTTPPNYWYFDRSTYPVRYTRLQFQKHRLSKKLKTFDPMLSEWENMKANGYDRIWDCGNSKWVWSAK